MIEVTIHTDGACSGNPGPGGWGAILTATENGTIISEKEIFGGDENTTNNRMELTAAIQALGTLKFKSKVILHTDSKYLMDGINEWIKVWKENDWRTSNKNLVKNKDLWEDIDKFNQFHDIEWKWVKGHSGDIGNETADELANKAIINKVEKKNA